MNSFFLSKPTSTRETNDTLDELYFLEGLSTLFSPAVRNLEVHYVRRPYLGREIYLLHSIRHTQIKNIIGAAKATVTKAFAVVKYFALSRGL